MTYVAPVDEYAFILGQLFGFGQVLGADRYGETSFEDCCEILAAAGKLSEEVLGPLQVAGDRTPSAMDNGVVRTPPGYREGYRAIAEGGWIGISAGEEFGGMALPHSLRNAVNDMTNGACASLGLSPLLTQSQIEALEAHGSDHLKRVYLPKLIAGEWLGTMCMTEPQAGSDIGSLRTMARPCEDGTYAVSGEKIYISWADADFVSNVSHFVLARLPDARPGSKGLSLFVVPKFIPREDGACGIRNDVRVMSLEHKLGLHGSPTGVMLFEGAKGWLVGEPGGGIRAMFTMMNSARLGVGTQGVAIGDGALALAEQFVSTRKQGTPPEGTGDTINGHPDVRRRMQLCRANLFAARALCADVAFSMDMADCTGERSWDDRVAFLTPIAKSFGSDIGVETALACLQLHGGAGYIEGTGAAQYLRDAVVTTIYEGTNGIQAIDLVGRKLADSGHTALRVLDEVAKGADSAAATMPALAARVSAAHEAVEETTRWLSKEACTLGKQAGAVAYLRAFALLLGGHYHLRAAAEAGMQGPRHALAQTYCVRSLSHCASFTREARHGAGDLY